jgi:replicative DNA helicase
MTIRVAYCVGSQLYEIQEAIKSLQQAGCRIVWIDYVQKIRGSRDDRRNDVSSSFSALHRQCYELDLAAIFVSQFSRQPEPGRQPKVHWLKESGDLENEARVIVLCQRDARDSALVHARVAKSTYGGEGVTWYYRRDDRGNLMEDDDMPRVAIP